MMTSESLADIRWYPFNWLANQRGRLTKLVLFPFCFLGCLFLYLVLILPVLVLVAWEMANEKED